MSLTHYGHNFPMGNTMFHTVADRAAWGMLGELSRRSGGDDVFMFSPSFPMSIFKMMDMSMIEEYYEEGRRVIEENLQDMLEFIDG